MSTQQTAATEHVTQDCASTTGIPGGGVAAVLQLLAEGATVPFIARYRKEATGGLDEKQIRRVESEAARIRTREARRTAVLSSLEKRGLLSLELSQRLEAATDIAQIEDLYAPYRPKRRTRATAALEAGLGPAAYFILTQGSAGAGGQGGADTPAHQAGTGSAEHAVTGALDIIAEWLAEHPDLRAAVRRLFAARALLHSARKRGVAAEGQAARFADYFDHTEPAPRAPSHRVLAVFRGENEGALRVTVRPPEGAVRELVESMVVGNGRARKAALSWEHLPAELREAGRGGGPALGSGSACAELLRRAVADSCSRLLVPSLESEYRAELKQRVDGEALEVFARNLDELLMAPPLPDTPLLALDPGLRTGCKVVCLDERGSYLDGATIFPLAPHKRTQEAARVLGELVARHGSQAVAVGNGTGGREALAFVEGLGLGIPAIAVSEAGASVYSASELAGSEFPELDVTVRGAISIGRRLADPLSELVKIDPKAIGVGQYQHDVDQKRLQARLDEVVLSCVNRVGVDLNSAGAPLLRYVSGLSPRLAEALVLRRNELGGFQNRSELLQVAGLGPKIFEQAAGFLRLRGGTEPLDAGAVHPERYSLVRRMAAELGLTSTELMNNPAARASIQLENYVTDEVGLPTLHDIMRELEKPGRDPRGVLEPMRFADVHHLSDLKPGMQLPGVVTNITAFGAFVDLGVHQDGLVHISKLANRYVSDPHEIVSLGKQVMVTVLDVDEARARVSLSMCESMGDSTDAVQKDA